MRSGTRCLERKEAPRCSRTLQRTGQRAQVWCRSLWPFGRQFDMFAAALTITALGECGAALMRRARHAWFGRINARGDDADKGAVARLVMVRLFHSASCESVPAEADHLATDSPVPLIAPDRPRTRRAHARRGRPQQRGDCHGTLSQRGYRQVPRVEPAGESWSCATVYRSPSRIQDRNKWKATRRRPDLHPCGSWQWREEMLT